MTTPLKIVFAGTPEFGLPCLDALHQSPHQLVAVYTQPDRPAGRGRHLQPSAVKTWAMTHHVPVYQPLHFKQQETIDALAALSPDLLIVIAYGLILPKAVLTIPRLGCINVHASLLPRWRGASPIQQAILHGDKQTGVTIMQMDVGMDTGDMLMKVSCDIGTLSAGQLHDRLATLSVKPLLTTVDTLAQGTAKGDKQVNEQATYAAKISKEAALIAWQQPAVSIEQQIRAYNPWPIAYTLAQQSTLRIYQAKVIATSTTQTPGTILSLDKQGILVATGDGALLIERLQFPGKKPMLVADWLNANREQLSVGMVLGSQ